MLNDWLLFVYLFIYLLPIKVLSKTILLFFGRRRRMTMGLGTLNADIEDALS